MFRIEADSLHRLVYNSLLFDTKSAKAYRVGGDIDPVYYLFMNTSDGQVYLEDQAPIKDMSGESQWIMSAEESKALETDLRKVEGELTIKFGKALTVDCLHPYFHGVYDVSIGEYAQQSELFDRRKQVRLYEHTFSINPDRLRKIALLQPRDYPVDCELVLIDDIPTPVISFTKGPSVRGTYATLSKV